MSRPKRGYVAVGPLRGWCGHTHRTAAAAQRCVEKDQLEMSRMQNAYSDRRVYATEDLPTRGSSGEYYIPTNNPPSPVDVFNDPAPEPEGVQLKCYHEGCGYEWTYRGTSTIWATCPSCMNKVRITKARG